MRRVAAAALILWASSPLAAQAQPLPALDIDESAVTVSGLSSGAFMAVQLHVAYSSVFSGAGVVAGGPFACASGTFWPRLMTATTICMDLEGDFVPFQGPPDVDASAKATAAAHERDAIDDPGNLADDRVYLFSGSEDATVPPAVMDTVREYYARYVDPGAIRYVNDIAAGHGLATLDEGVACDATGAPYLNDCDYDTAHEILAHLFHVELKPPDDDAGTLSAFDQAGYVGDAVDPADISLSQTGYVFVPAECEGGSRCRLHVVLHGCRQHASAVGTAFVEQAGFNRWAAANRTVVLYPQARATTSWWPDRTNPRGCWDWWGYTGAAYFERDAPQLRAVMNMVRALAAGENRQ